MKVLLSCFVLGKFIKKLKVVIFSLLEGLDMIRYQLIALINRVYCMSSMLAKGP